MRFSIAVSKSVNAIAHTIATSTSVMIVNLSVNLIHLIPDTALQWLGFHTQSSSAGNRSGENFTAVATVGTAAGRDIMGKAMANIRARRGKAADDKAKADMLNMHGLQKARAAVSGG
ncbi:hypothetical protein [Ferrigenium sp. UT5]|uniref:hypothetical protein n=1 Tax=Ferrigenium sp. UT5 TaxID=3242105 RepID=UPI0035540A37